MPQREQDDAARLEMALDRIVRALARLPQPWQDGTDASLSVDVAASLPQPAGLDAQAAAALTLRLDTLIADLRQALGDEDLPSTDEPATPRDDPGPALPQGPATQAGALEQPAPSGDAIAIRQPPLPMAQASDPARPQRGPS